jgi:hypothetical protein
MVQSAVPIVGNAEEVTWGIRKYALCRRVDSPFEEPAL